jgi:hypothetical protein
MPHINIKHVTSKIIQHSDNEKLLHLLSHHVAQDALHETPIPDIQVPQVHQTLAELLINNKKISSNYVEELRMASAKPELWLFY